MKYRGFKKENFAVAGVIEALLLIALVAVILSTIQLYYVPEIMQQKESDHMDVVANQFSHLKSVIDSQSLMGVLESGEAVVYAPMSSPITLGSNELPYFVSARSSGQVNIIDRYKADDSKIDTDDLLNVSDDFSDGIPLTSLKYRAYNAYFPEGASWQEYILEGGGIFLRQYDGVTVLVQQSISLEEIDGGDTIKINYVLPLFKGIPGKNITGGFKDCFIRTNYSKHYTLNISDIGYLRIYTDYIEAWNQSLRNDDSGILWQYYDNNDINIDFDNPIDPQYIEIIPSTKNIDLHFTIVEIGIQTGPGIVYQYE